MLLAACAMRHCAVQCFMEEHANILQPMCWLDCMQAARQHNKKLRLLTQPKEFCVSLTDPSDLCKMQTASRATSVLSLLRLLHPGSRRRCGRRACGGAGSPACSSRTRLCTWARPACCWARSACPWSAATARGASSRWRCSRASPATSSTRWSRRFASRNIVQYATWEFIGRPSVAI